MFLDFASLGTRGESCMFAHVGEPGVLTEEEKKAMEDKKAARAISKAALKRRKEKKKTDEYSYYPITEELYNTLNSFYNFKGVLDQSLLFGRSEQFTKIYYVSPPLAAILRVQRNERVKVVHTGVRVFELRNETKGQGHIECNYRVVQEGMHIVSKAAQNQQIIATEQDTSTLIRSGCMKLEEFSPDTLAQLQNVKLGCVIVNLKAPNVISDRDLMLACWKTPYTVNLMISKVDQKSLQNKLIKLEEVEKETVTEDVEMKEN